MSAAALSSTSSSSSSSLEWAESLIGRYWEVYWRQESNEATASTSEAGAATGAGAAAGAASSSSRQRQESKLQGRGGDDPKVMNGDMDEEENEENSTASSEEEEEVHADDWYDAKVESYYAVAVRGGEEENGSSPPSTPSSASFVFKVRFVGDEDGAQYDMVLTPQIVRPSARAWIRRTLALLLAPRRPPSGDDSGDVDDASGRIRDKGEASASADGPAAWFAALPLDTATIDDHRGSEESAVTLARLRGEAAAGDMPPLPDFSPSNDPGSGSAADPSTPAPAPADLDSIRELVVQIRWQVHLRSRLTAVGESPQPSRNSGDTQSSRSDDDEEDGPTNEYLDYLVACLRRLESSCLWYYRCWALHSRVLGVSSDSSPPPEPARLERDYVLKDCLEAGRREILSVHLTDPSVAALRRKRKSRELIAASPAPSASPQRRTKRRRKNRSFGWEDDGAEASAMYDTLEQDNLLSPRQVEAFLGRIQSTDSRWFLVALGAMLRSLSVCVVAPIVSWMRRANACIDPFGTDGSGLTCNDEVSMNDDESSGEDDESNDDSSSRHGEAGQSGRSTKNGVFNYEDIEAMVEAAESNRVLRHVELRDIVLKLNEKLAAIDALSEAARMKILAVLDDSNDGGASLISSDEILTELKRLLKASRSRDAPRLCNVDHLGRHQSNITRSVMESAIAYRTWYLRFRRVSAVRERASLARLVVSDFETLPPVEWPSGDTDVNERFVQLAPLVKALEAKLADAESLYEQYNPLPSDSAHPLTESEGLQVALRGLSSSGFVSEIEEMMSVRLDILALRSEVVTVLSSDRPQFSDLLRIKAGFDLILQGKSSCRRELIKSLEGDNSIDTRIHDFAYQDVRSIFGGEYDRFDSLFERTASWKNRAEAVITALRLHGNESAGSRLTSPKLPAMVDLKRVADLLDEVPIVPFDLSELAQTIERIHSTCVEWAQGLSSMLSNCCLSFDECLQLLRERNRGRPEGIIMSPTRQVVDTIEDLLVWYTTVNQVCASEEEKFSRLDLIVEGVEIVETFSQTAGLFTVARAEALELLARKVPSRCLGKVISCNKLRSNALSEGVLSRMLLSSRDVGDDNPLRYLLHILWVLAVEDFTDKSLHGVGNDRMLETAKVLLNQRPLTAQALGLSSPVSDSHFPVISTLTELVTLADSTEAEARKTIAETKVLLHECLRRPFEVPSQLSKLKNLAVALKSPTSGAGLMFDPALVHQLDHDVKLLSWLLKAFQYPVLRTRHTASSEQLTMGGGSDPRVPWDVLVTLVEKLPETGDGLGDFAYVALRVKELHEAAAAWQDDVSSFTKLSLRGVKRRSQQSLSPAASGQPSDVTRTADQSNVAELSNDPILLEVSMPRQSAMQTMLSATSAFEALLCDFLGKDYEGVGPDRAPYPSSGSLMGIDGSFILYRLTKSPLFGAFRASIDSISEVAGNVFADTPGKVAFDWIRKVAYWIDSLHQSVRVMSLPYGGMKLVIPCQNARQLLLDGNHILLDVPNDLRKTLSNHKIFISTNNLGRLTVKTMKGGAHHAVGVTAIRWCPLLFDALKADFSRYEKWQKDMGDVAGSFVTYSKQPPTNYEESVLLLHRFHDEVSDLLVQALDLVVAPVESTLENGNRILWGIKSRLASSTPAIARKYASQKYSEPPSLVHNRHVLLDSLSRRQCTEANAEKPSVASNTKDGPFRGAARVLLQNALLNGVAVVGMDNSTHEAVAFCALKAWAIENELFASFQSEAAFGDAKISPEYRDFARALKRSLDDPDNLSFCLHVLTGKVDAEAISRMSILDLANPKTKEERARAAASHNVVLDGSSKPAPLKDPPTKTKSDPSERTKVETIRSSVHSGSEESEPASSPSAVIKVDVDRPGLALKLSDVVKNSTASNHRPPPPPSLAASLVAVPSASKKSDAPVTNASGTDRSNVTVSVTSFVAGFVTETDPYDKAVGLLPENWLEKGRLKNEEFAKFLHNKLEGGKWSVVTYRLITFSNKDDRELKKYIKEYEARNRLAMFSLAPESKIFLVTPKFHSSARNLSFENASSTYAVALVRR